MAAGEAAGAPQWEGTVTAKLLNLTTDSVWSIIQDFCGLHNWFPLIHKCYPISGEHGQPGLIRYCDNGAGGEDFKWCHEKLLSFDPINRTLSYQIMENNMGMKSYTATMQVMPVEGSGCQIEWSFVSDPIEGLRCEDFVAYLEAGLQQAATKMEEENSSSSNSLVN